jgi:hypothetical protein
MNAMRQRKFQQAYAVMNATPPDVLTKDEQALEWLPIETVQVNEDVFQPRNLRDTQTKAESDAQVAVLLDDLENDGVLDKITVWKWQGHWWCVDGFHRLMAYRHWQAKGTGKAGRKRSRIPVKVVEGSLKDVRGEADKENFKTKLNVPLVERSNTAWEWTKLGHDTAWIVEHARVSRRTAFYMKSTLARL